MFFFSFRLLQILYSQSAIDPSCTLCVCVCACKTFGSWTIRHTPPHKWSVGIFLFACEILYTALQFRGRGARWVAAEKLPDAAVRGEMLCKNHPNLKPVLKTFWVAANSFFEQRKERVGFDQRYLKNRPLMPFLRRFRSNLTRFLLYPSSSS